MKPFFLRLICLALLPLLLIQCKSEPSTKETDSSSPMTTPKEEVPPPPKILEAKKISMKPVLNGIGNDYCWNEATWHPIDQLWIGEAYTPDDFTGRYKMAWSEDKLYILAEITDDVLKDIRPDGLDEYWDDDCLEVFIDEDHSGGNHQYNYNAFAYHISLDYKVVDIGMDSLPHYYNDHIKSARVTKGNTYIWELAMTIYDDTYRRDEKNTPVTLSAGKEIGFAIAYCDNDKNYRRENFIGSVYVPGEDKNQGWIDAGIFGTVRLVE